MGRWESEMPLGVQLRRVPFLKVLSKRIALLGKGVEQMSNCWSFLSKLPSRDTASALLGH